MEHFVVLSYESIYFPLLTLFRIYLHVTILSPHLEAERVEDKSIESNDVGKPKSDNPTGDKKWS